MTKTTYVVAGNGASLAQPFEGRILGSDFMLRTNNFFFEPCSFLGPRVDLAVMGGDPRVAPFMFETLWQCRKTYDLRHWTSHNPAVVRAGKRRFAPRYKPLSFGPPALAPQVQALIAKYDRKPMTGTYALLAACGLHMAAPPETRGAIILAGMDLYGTDTRYAYQSSKNQMALLGHDLNHRRLDSRLRSWRCCRRIPTGRFCAPPATAAWITSWIWPPNAQGPRLGACRPTRPKTGRLGREDIRLPCCACYDGGVR